MLYNVANSSNNGIIVNNSNSDVYFSNTLSSNKHNGLQINDGKNTNITGNSISFNGGYGIYLVKI